MAGIIERLAQSVDTHDLDAATGLVHDDYRSEQRAHPSRSFTGRAQMRANWEAMSASPDACSEGQEGEERRELRCRDLAQHAASGLDRRAP